MSAGPLQVPLAAAGRSKSFRRVLASDKVALGAVIVIAIVLIVTLLAPVFAPQDPNSVNLSEASQGSSGAHLLGTDENGRDLLSRLIWGARPTIFGTATIVAIACLLGTAVALFAAWQGGVIDAALSRALDIGFAFPSLLLAILAVAVFGVGLTASILALAIAYIPYIARIVRASAVRERSLPYVSALTVQGASGWRVAFRHLLPNLWPVIAVQATISFAYALIDLASLSYLGLGVQPPTSDWGSMVADGQIQVLAGNPQESLYAGAMIVITVCSFTIIGERLSARASEAVR